MLRLALPLFVAIVMTTHGHADPACNRLVQAACITNTITAQGVAAATPVLKAVKDRGGFRDLGHCEEIARNGGALGGLIGGKLAGLISGKCGECACRIAFQGFGYR